MSKMNTKMEKLTSIIAQLESVVVAFSGGVDSSFLTWVAFDVLGDKALAVTASSETYSAAELRSARRLAAQIGVEHIVVKTAELHNPNYSANPSRRCYYCKSELFKELEQVKARKGFCQVIEASNKDDLSDYRPGFDAAREGKIRQPLVEAGFTKAEIRRAAKRLGLTNWARPASPCLASRIPYGEPINQKKLAMIESAERYLRRQQLPDVRVRYHGTIARIEVAPEHFPIFIQNAKKISRRLKAIGFVYVTLDLEGFRSGSMNEVLP